MAKSLGTQKVMGISFYFPCIQCWGLRFVTFYKMLASIAKSVRGAVSNASASSSIHTLPKLNYDVTAGLAPVISPAALDLHYNKHHATYVANTNKLVEGTVFEGRSLEEVIKSTANEAKHAALFNNSAQVRLITSYFIQTT